MPVENSAHFALSRRDCPAVFSGSGPSTGQMPAQVTSEKAAPPAQDDSREAFTIERYSTRISAENARTGTREITADRRIWQTAQPFRVGGICDYVCAGKSRIRDVGERRKARQALREKIKIKAAQYQVEWRLAAKPRFCAGPNSVAFRPQGVWRCFYRQITPGSAKRRANIGYGKAHRRIP